MPYIHHEHKTVLKLNNIIDYIIVSMLCVRVLVDTVFPSSQNRNVIIINVINETVYMETGYVSAQANK